MKIEIKSEKKNPLLKRTEYDFVVEHAGEPTPTKKAVVEELAKMTKANKDTVVLKSIDSSYGMGLSKGYAKVYESKEAAQEIEPEYIQKRNGIAKPPYAKPAAAEEQPKEA